MNQNQALNSTQPSPATIRVLKSQTPDPKPQSPLSLSACLSSINSLLQTLDAANTELVTQAKQLAGIRTELHGIGLILDLSHNQPLGNLAVKRKKAIQKARLKRLGISTLLDNSSETGDSDVEVEIRVSGVKKVVTDNRRYTKLFK